MADLSTEGREAIRSRMDDIETRVWDHLRHHRFFEGMGLIELWHILHRESGAKLANPFQDIAALARRKYTEKLTREGI